MNALDMLALRVGIEDRFRDAKGELRETSLETKRALLSAMKFQANSEEDAFAALAALDEQQWLRSLPPVRVAYASKGTVELDAVVPVGTSRITWRLELEGGENLSGTAECDDTTLRDKREIRGRLLQRHRVRLSGPIPYGYHLLRCELDDFVCSLIVTPGQCWLPEAAAQRERLWGIAVQLYLLRSATNWGIGDFTDLRKLVELVDQLGGDVVGLNPLHSMFLDNPEHASPYSPESRLLLNVLNIDVEAVPELAESPETQQLIASEAFQVRLSECRQAPLVDYAGVAELKLQALKLLFECCRTNTASNRWLEFQAFRNSAGQAFEQSCVFEALRQHFASITGALADWHSWPVDYQHPSSSAVTRFAEEHSGAVTLYAWLQWLADQQLGAAAAAANPMQVGLYRDLAVGTDSGGAATWSNPDAVVSFAHAGAPPDIHNPAGQDWGLPPFHPRILYETGYRNFIDLVRANMRHAGGLRVDHVMALQHLYWVPAGRSPREGAYVQYPLDDLIGIIALESHRNRCLVVGEDLGTVPEGFRERMMEAGVLSYRVLFLEQDTATGSFLPPDSYPRLAVAVAGSHDLPTTRGWWEGTDITIKERLHLFPDPKGADEARDQRARDRRELVQALRSEGLLPSEGSVHIEQLTDAVHAYLARTNALITVAQIDDITAETDPVNVPATSHEHPNWRRRLSLTIEQLATHPRMRRLTRVLEECREPEMTRVSEDIRS
jgi:4-alpha-glucanotransferase